jgi:formate dehydrogenase subunit delta
MNTDRLIQMANSIGDFFASMPDADEARNGIADHIHKFWAPRMRQGLFAQIDGGGAGELQPLVLQALQQHRAELVQTDRERPLQNFS